LLWTDAFFFYKGLPATTLHRESLVHDFDISLGRLDYDGAHLVHVSGYILNALAREWRIGLMDSETNPDVVASLISLYFLQSSSMSRWRADMA
jgi:hypothetical protein